MRKPDEIALAREVLACWRMGGIFPDEVGWNPTESWLDHRMRLTRREDFILSKWSGDVRGMGAPPDRIWWESGVSTRCGWLTEDGVAALTEIVDREKDWERIADASDTR
jgi:hypothetical protein